MTTEELHNLIKLAEQGDAETQFALGEYYYLSTDNRKRRRLRKCLQGSSKVVS